MNRRILLAIISLAAFALQAGLRTRLQTEQEESNLVITAADQRGMSADIAVPVLALGAFRGVVVDYLWLRSIALRDQGRTYEARQIAEMICRLQPRLPAVWSYLASHLAYDLAATDPSAPGRYRWVQNGIQLLRDQGLRYNPDAAELYYTLGRIYQDKIGATMDEFHKEMKHFLALDMLFLLGPLSLAELAQTPPLEALIQQDAQAAALEAALRGALETDREGVIARLLALEYQLARGKREELKPDLRRVLSFRDEAGYSKFLRAARRTQFAARSKMSVRRMLEVDRTWGPTDGSGLDWHAAETHALYWSLEGIRVGKEHDQDRDVRRCRQTAVLALKNAMRRGRIRFFDDGSTFTAPIPALVERLERIYRANIDAARSEAEAARRDPESSQKQILQANAHLNNQVLARADFLGEAITLLAQYGRDTDGRRLLAIAHKAYPSSPEFDIPYESFLLNTLAKRYSDAGLFDSQSGMTQLLEGTWSQAFVFLALGEDTRYRTFERLAKASERRWSAYLAAQAKEEAGVHRRLGINYTLVQQRALQQAARRLPLSLRGMLAQRAGVSVESLGGPPPKKREPR